MTRLLNRLSLRAKFVLIGLVASAAMLTALGFLLSTLQESIAFSAKERLGVEYHKPLRHLLEKIASAQGDPAARDAVKPAIAAVDGSPRGTHPTVCRSPRHRASSCWNVRTSLPTIPARTRGRCRFPPHGLRWRFGELRRSYVQAGLTIAVIVHAASSVGSSDASAAASPTSTLTLIRSRICSNNCRFSSAICKSCCCRSTS